MTELEPCPFCKDGGTVEVYHDFMDLWHINCRECGCMTGAYPSEEHAASVWNTRAECTCRWSHDDYHDETNNIWTTECGERFSWESFGHPKCCPNCGAKVVSE